MVDVSYFLTIKQIPAIAFWQIVIHAGAYSTYKQEEFRKNKRFTL